MISCSSTKMISHGTEKLGNDLKIKTNSFLSIIPDNSQVIQYVSYERDGDLKDTQVILRRKKDLLVTVLSPIGLELISLRVTDAGVERLGGIAQFKLELFRRVMADMLAVYAPKRLLLEESLGDLKVTDSENKRVISVGTKKVITIDYTQADKWKSDIHLEHLELNYKLNIKTLTK